MNPLSAGVLTIAGNNLKRIALIKKLSLEFALCYAGSVKIEVNIDKEKTIAKMNISEYNV